MTQPTRFLARRWTVLALVAVSAAVLGGCGSSGGRDGAAETTAATTAAPTTTAVETTLPVTTTTAAATTTTTAVPANLSPEETAVAFVRALVEGRSADAYVQDPAVASDAERQLGEMGTAAYDSIAIDPVRSQQEAGAPDQCAVNDVTLSCYVLIDRSSSDAEGVNTLLKVGVAVNDLAATTGPEDVGPKVPAFVISVEVVPS